MKSLPVWSVSVNGPPIDGRPTLLFSSSCPARQSIFVALQLTLALLDFSLLVGEVPVECSTGDQEQRRRLPCERLMLAINGSHHSRQRLLGPWPHSKHGTSRSPWDRTKVAQAE